MNSYTPDIDVKLGFDPLETAAFRCMKYWHHYFMKYFPTGDSLFITKHKDPRDTFLFKNCYKMVKQVHGRVTSDAELKLFVHAQLCLFNLHAKIALKDQNERKGTDQRFLKWYPSPTILISEKRFCDTNKKMIECNFVRYNIFKKQLAKTQYQVVTNNPGEQYK